MFGTTHTLDYLTLQPTTTDLCYQEVLPMRDATFLRETPNRITESQLGVWTFLSFQAFSGMSNSFICDHYVN
jgi:hypothetical protein